MSTRLKVFLGFIVVVSFLSSCKKEPSDPSTDEDTFVIYDYSINNLSFVDEFYWDSTVGDTLKINLLPEASGLAVSRSNPSFFWTHNDSGHPNWLFPVPASGDNYGYIPLSGAGARDWEDICIGPGPVDGVNYIYVADIGENQNVHSFIVVYRVPEPDISNISTNHGITINADDVERFEFTYPDGPVDAESIMIDPWTKDIYIVTKSGYRSILYRAKAPQNSTQRTELEKLAQFPFNGAVASDISADGYHIGIKTFSRIYYWHRETGQSVVDAMKVQPRLLPYILEPQGEAFGWLPDASGYFTLSEKSGIYPPIIYYYTKN